MSTPGEVWYGKADRQWNVLKREQYTYPFAENSVVRYIDVTDSRDLESLLTYINTLATVTNPVTQGNAVTGTWKNKGCGYLLVNPNTPLQAIRIWNELVPVADTSTPDWLFTENNCTFKVSIQNYYRRATIDTPTSGSSGITYAVTNQMRDPVSGLWTYVVEKREQYTTFIAEHKVANTDFETEYEQKFLGVRESTAGSGIYTKDHADNAISALWSIVEPNVQGISITQSLSKNANCTADITQHKVVAKISVQEAVQREKTEFSYTETITVRNELAAVSAYVSVVGGVVTIQASKRNDDGTFNNTKITKTAIAYDSEVTREQTVFSQFVSIVKRNQAAAVNVFVAVSNGIVTRRFSHKNEDGTFDNTEETRTAIAAEAVVERSRSAFRDTVTITNRNQAAAVNAFVNVINGIITTRSSKKNDDGTFDNTEATSTAIAVSNAVVEHSRTAFRDIVTITNRNQTTAVSAFVNVVNGIITTQGYKENDDKTFDNTETLSTAIGVLSAVAEKSRTLFMDSVTVTNRNQPTAVSALVEVANGIITEQGYRENDDGTFDNTETLGTARAVADATVIAEGDAFSTSTRKIQRNQAAADATAAGLTGGGTAAAKLVSVRNDKTEAGRFTQEKGERLPSAAWSCTLEFAGDRKTITVLVFGNQTQTALQALATALGTVANVSCSFRPNEFYLLDGSIVASVDDEGSSVEWTAWSEHVREYERLANGEVLLLEGTAVFGFNVSDGASTFYSASGYRQYSFFRDVGRNWYTYKLITSVTPYVAG